MPFGPGTAARVREIGAEQYIPYVRHIDETTIALANGAVMTMIALDGVAFETVDTSELNALHRALNILYRNVADERLAVWSHVVRRRSRDDFGGAFRSGFSERLDQKYRDRLVETDLFRNEIVLSLVWTPSSGAGKTAAQTFGRLIAARKSGVETTPDAIKAIADKTADVLQGLSPWGPRRLGLYERDGLMFSAPCEALQRMIGGRAERVPLVDGLLSSAIYADRIVFGRETAEIRTERDTRVAGMLGFREYPAATRPGMLDGILSAPFECVLSQSFRFLSKTAAKEVMGRKQNQMISSGDKAGSQIAQLTDALDDLESNRFVLGEHHISLSVGADTPKKLADNIGLARSILTNGGAVVAREDLALEAAWWGQLPGNFHLRPRSGAITSLNFAALAPMHGFPSGRREGNPWGSAVAMLKASSGSPYYFSFHDPDSGLGNTFVCGPSGSGKTVILNFLMSQLEKHDPWMVLFDKDRGAELFVRATGGTYLALANGRPTGCAPLKALSSSRADLAYLEQWVTLLVKSDAPLDASQRAEIAFAVEAVMALPVEQRTIGALRQHMSNTERNGIAQRLARWETGQPLGWVFDNPRDEIGFEARFVGYDMTEFLDNPEIRTPLMSYLFRRVEQLIDGRRIVISIDEFWKALGDEAFRDLAQNKLKTIRKQNGFLLFATQSPRDALASPIAHTIIEQCATQVLLPNPRADRADYVDGFKLTSREHALVARELTAESRRFLVKQGHHSVVAELDLSGFDDELAILSGKTANVELLTRLLEELGDVPPEVWLPRFHAARKAG